ncbi:MULTISPECIES: hypothetical protein [Hydrocarboniphaga]|uniref:Uncharacterized protein n=1 Tax=Hydrocarboniphaga effusa AP103 TaxID=1172194 RepID=I7ZEQ4_9GAMM|nr:MULTISPECIES: hypothetical protein [Hydrocarboniphaga]EIT69985.1 hypothetical protein WQQ_01220 [Hydrocarboniphaga effusa AP103]EIT70172.1 hypothetical protein WQQ_03090 [Hydrocarboniphaga effusa AP103]MDZ4077198.1 hypothetical protein [Hydrocarboniphaga sp.]
MSAIDTPMRKPAQRGPGTGKRRSFIASRTASTWQRAAHRSLAAIAAGFLPVAAYVLAHVEITAEKPLLWALVGASLIYSAPSLAEWAEGWCRSRIKAWAFAVLLEGVMLASAIQALSLTGLMLLVIVNAAFAWRQAGENKEPHRSRVLGGDASGGASDVLPME